MNIFSRCKKNSCLERRWRVRTFKGTLTAMKTAACRSERQRQANAEQVYSYVEHSWTRLSSFSGAYYDSTATSLQVKHRGLSTPEAPRRTDLICSVCLSKFESGSFLYGQITPTAAARCFVQEVLHCVIHRHVTTQVCGNNEPNVQSYLMFDSDAGPRSELTPELSVFQQ